MKPLQRFVVVAREDGRGGFRPFGTYNVGQAGAYVNIGDREYKVGVDGRVNIPKRIMETYGVTGTDGRSRVTIEFASKAGPDGWGEVAAAIGKPPDAFSEALTGDIVDRENWIVDTLEPRDTGDYNWSY